MSNFEKIYNVAIENGSTAKFDEPMKLHTTFKIGGNARLFIFIESVEALKKIVNACNEENIDFLIIGNGSNMLVSDDGINKVIIKLGKSMSDIRQEGNKIICEAGVSLAKLSNFAKENSLTGLEFAWGIPGCVGGAIYMNAGAYGGEIKQVVTSVTHLTPEGKIETICADLLNFGYRHSAYCENNCIILSAEFTLTMGKKADIQDKMDGFMKARQSKQPIEFPSAGSVFKRPKGYFAAALIEECKLKGYSVGGAKVSEKHSGFIINYNNATCDDVTKLIKYIQDTVFKEKGVLLETEVKRIMDDN